MKTSQTRLPRCSAASRIGRRCRRTCHRSIVALLRGCLEKDRRRRIGDLSTARFVIDREGDAVAAVAVRLPQDPAGRFDLAAVAAAAGIAAYTTFSITRVSPPSLPLARFTIALPVGDRFANTGVPVVALSPDARLVHGEPTTLPVDGPARADAHPRHGRRS